MPRPYQVALLFLATLCGAQQTPPTALDADPSGRNAPGQGRRARITLAEEALASGLASTAGELFSAALADTTLSPAERNQAGMGLASALIERSRLAEAKAALRFVQDGPAKALREGLVAALENDMESAARHASTAAPETLPEHERGWALTLRWMVAETNGSPSVASAAREAALRAAVSPEQRARMEALGGLALVRSGKVDDGSLVALRELSESARGTALSFVYARNLALALSRLKRPQEAARALTEAGPFAAERQAEADLLAGLILGEESAEGRERLRSAARNRAGGQHRLTALRALAAGAAALKVAADAPGVANETYDFLMRTAPGGSGYLCPRDPEVVDAIHLTRAQLMLAAGNMEKARLAAEDLLREAPASPLAREAIRTLALAAWNEGSFRLAATHLAALAEGTQGARSDSLRVVSADCLFLARDFTLAEKTYAAVQSQTTDPRIATDAFHQRIHCLLLQGDDPVLWKRATELVEDSARGQSRVTPDARWMAAWNIVDAVRRAGQPAEASRILVRLQPLLVGVTADYAIRFDWQRALIALAQRQRQTAAQIAERIGQTLRSLPGDAPADLRSELPSLLGQVELLRIRALTGAEGETLTAKNRDELRKLRKDYGKTAAAASSYLFEGRELSRLGLHAEAQATFTELADGYRNVTELREFSRLGLYEAAEQAALLASAAGMDKLLEAVELLERFAETGPSGPLAFHAALRRSEMLRSMGDFDKALRVVEDLIRDAPSDPSRPRAEMARGDCLLGLAELRRTGDLGMVDRQRAARAAAAYERVAETWGKDSPEIRIEARHKQAISLIERAKAEGGADAIATRREVRATLAANAALLRADPSAAASSNARIWLSRSILLLSEACEQAGDRKEAAAACRIIIDFNRGVKPAESRLPGQVLAESKLAALESGQSNPSTPK